MRARLCNAILHLPLAPEPGLCSILCHATLPRSIPRPRHVRPTARVPCHVHAHGATFPCSVLRRASPMTCLPLSLSHRCCWRLQLYGLHHPSHIDAWKKFMPDRGKPSTTSCQQIYGATSISVQRQSSFVMRHRSLLDGHPLEIALWYT